MKRKEPKYKYNYVMLLDDRDLDNFINTKMIEANYFAEKIYVNSSGKSALEFLLNLCKLGEQGTVVYPEVIFIDVNMPLIDGFQFIEYFKKIENKKLQQCKLVVLTSSIYAEDKEKTQKLSKDIIFLNKPLTDIALSTL